MAGRGTTNIQLCGRLVIELSSRRVEDRLPGRQGRLLFAYLTVNRHRPVPRAEIVDALWPGQPPSAPDLLLSPLISKLRRAVGDEIVHGRSELQLRLPADAWVDLEAATEAVHRAEAAIATADWTRAYGPAAVAGRVARREFLPSEDAPWIDEVRRRLEDVLVRALECDVACSLEIGGAELAPGLLAARELVRRAPYHEAGHRLLMRALAATGETAEALLVYERLRCRLRDEIGTVPSTETQAVHARLLGVAG